VKNKKWLLIAVIILLIINISFFILIHLVKVNELIQTKFSTYLSQRLKAHVSIGYFSFNDRQLNIYNLEIKDLNKNYSIEIKQIYIGYNLLKLILSKFKNLKAINQIQIYEPKIDLLIQAKKNKKAKKINIPDISQYFRLLNIFNGNFSIQYKSNLFSLQNEWKNISITVNNSKYSNIKFQACSSDSSIIDADFLLKKEKILGASIHLKDFYPDKLTTNIVDSLSAKLDFDLQYNKKILNYKGKIKNIYLSQKGNSITAKNMNYKGSNDSLYVHFSDLFLNNDKIMGDAKLLNIFKKNRKISAQIEGKEILISKYNKVLSGKTYAKLNVSGFVSNPQITGSLTSNKIEIVKQNFNNVKMIFSLEKKNLLLKLEHAFWENNLIKGNGNYELGKAFNFRINSKNLTWMGNNLLVSGDVNSKITFQKKLLITVDSDNVSIKNNKYELNHLVLNANFHDNKDFDISINRKTHLRLDLSGNLISKNYQANLKLKRFDLNSILSSVSLPLISGDFAIKSDKDSIRANSLLRIYDQDFGKLDGRFKTNFTADLTHNKTYLSLKSYHAKFNYEPLKVELLANGTLDSIQTKFFKINDKILLETWIRRKPKFDFGIIAKGNNVKIRNYLKYFTNFYIAENIFGNVNFDLGYNTFEAGNILGKIELQRFHYSEMDELNASLHFQGTNSSLKVDRFKVWHKNKNILQIESDIILKPTLQIIALGKINNLNLRNIIPKSNISGLLNSKFSYSYQNARNRLNINLLAKKFDAVGFWADSLKIIATQEDSLLKIIEFSAQKKNNYNFFGKGSIGYNIWNETSYSDTNSISLAFNGNLLGLIFHSSKLIENPKSKCHFNFKVKMGENGLSVNNGNFSLTKASFKMKGQLEKFDKVKMIFEILNDKLNLKSCQMQMGEGKLYIQNEIKNDETDFMLGMLNLGQLKVHTNSNGLLLNLPKFIPHNTIIKTVIAGRYSDNLSISGPFNDIHIVGDLYFSNGGVIYPPNTENILKLVTKITESKKTPTVNLPLTLDLIFHVGDNIRYLTYPMNLLVNPGGYLNLRYEYGKLKIEDAFFVAEEGSLDLLGTEMKADYVQISLNQFIKGMKISGSFYKKTADGSLVTLEIFNQKDKEGNSLGKIQFKLASDNPQDNSLDIISKLRYGRNVEEISSAQENSLLQDKMIQMAGLGLENTFIEPFLYPLESKIRNLFKLDVFQLQTRFVQNFFNRYYYENNQDELLTENNFKRVTNFGSEMFLNNLSLRMSKYISKDFFLDYEVCFQKPTDLALTSKVGVYQNISLRYDLPHNFKLIYKYKIMPFHEKSSHEIMLEKSFRFW